MSYCLYVAGLRTESDFGPIRSCDRTEIVNPWRVYDSFKVRHATLSDAFLIHIILEKYSTLLTHLILGRSCRFTLRRGYELNTCTVHFSSTSDLNSLKSLFLIPRIEGCKIETESLTKPPVSQPRIKKWSFGSDVLEISDSYLCNSL